MRIIAGTPKERKKSAHEKVQTRLEITAKRGNLDASTLEWIAESYDRKKQKDARRYAFRLLALWRAGYLDANGAAAGAWRTLEERAKSLWINENGQVITRQIQEMEAEAKQSAKQQIRRERQVLGDLCGAILPNGEACGNKKMFGARHCYRHGGREELTAKQGR